MLDRRRSSRVLVGALETATEKQTMQMTRVVDAFFAAGGAAGSLMLLQILQDNFFVETPITGGFLVGSAIKFFLNRSPPSLEAFWKTTLFSIGIGCTLHSYMWRVVEGEATTIFSKEYNSYLLLFVMMLYWKLDTGTIWGAGKSLAEFLAFQSGFWGEAASSKDFRTALLDFPIWYLLGPYLLGHSFLYLCALGVSNIRKRARMFILRKDILSSPHAKEKSFIGPTSDRGKLRILFDRMDTSGDGRLDAMELKLAMRATAGEELSLETCKEMIGQVDTDGDGTLDFNEFCEAVDGILQ